MIENCVHFFVNKKCVRYILSSRITIEKNTERGVCGVHEFFSFYTREMKRVK